MFSPAALRRAWGGANDAWGAHNMIIVSTLCSPSSSFFVVYHFDATEVLAALPSRIFSELKTLSRGQDTCRYVIFVLIDTRGFCGLAIARVLALSLSDRPCFSFGVHHPPSLSQHDNPLPRIKGPGQAFLLRHLRAHLRHRRHRTAMSIRASREGSLKHRGCSLSLHAATYWELCDVVDFGASQANSSRCRRSAIHGSKT